MEAGEYEQPWDGKGRLGRSLASGVYFAELISEGHAQTEKIVLLR